MKSRAAWLRLSDSADVYGTSRHSFRRLDKGTPRLVNRGAHRILRAWKKAVAMHRNTRFASRPDSRRADIADRLRAGERLIREPGWEHVAVVVIAKATRRLGWLAADETDAEFRSIMGRNGIA